MKGGNIQVALVDEWSRSFGRDLLRGIARYAKLHGPWNCYVTPGDLRRATPTIRLWNGTGIIVRVETTQMARAVLKASLPAVLLGVNPLVLSRVSELSRLCNVCSDSEGAGRMAAEHLFERGFEHFAFVGVHGRMWSKLRNDAFCSAVRKRGFEPHVYLPPNRKKGMGQLNQRTYLGHWIKSLPKPLGVMACNDDRGYEVLDVPMGPNLCARGGSGHWCR
jgi:LacI family transcriptional regulator